MLMFNFNGYHNIFLLNFFCFYTQKLYFIYTIILLHSLLPIACSVHVSWNPNPEYYRLYCLPTSIYRHTLWPLSRRLPHQDRKKSSLSLLHFLFYIINKIKPKRLNKTISFHSFSKWIKIYLFEFDYFSYE